MIPVNPDTLVVVLAGWAIAPPQGSSQGLAKHT